MESLYLKYQSKFKEINETMDTENGHSLADKVIALIAIDAAKGKLSIEETKELVLMYNTAHKWYA